MNTIYETGEWPKNFKEVTTTALKKKPQATKRSEHRTISLIAPKAKIVTMVLSKKIERDIENVHGEDQFAFGRKKGTMNAIRMLGIISETNLGDRCGSDRRHLTESIGPN
jgi:hypothetical protein